MKTFCLQWLDTDQLAPVIRTEYVQTGWETSKNVRFTVKTGELDYQEESWHLRKCRTLTEEQYLAMGGNPVLLAQCHALRSQRPIPIMWWSGEQYKQLGYHDTIL